MGHRITSVAVDYRQTFQFKQFESLSPGLRTVFEIDEDDGRDPVELVEELIGLVEPAWMQLALSHANLAAARLGGNEDLQAWFEEYFDQEVERTEPRVEATDERGKSVKVRVRRKR